MRAAARFGALLLVLAGLACFALLVEPGPREVADWLGRACTNDRGRTDVECDALDATDLLVTFGGVLVVLGGALRLILRPADRGPRTLDLSRLRRGR